MSEPFFDVVFYGIIQPGKDRETVVQNMASLFKTEPEKLTVYFSGDRKIIKSGISQAAAEKYREALENVGLVIRIEDAAANSETKHRTIASTHQSQDETKPAQTGTGGITLAQAGADIIENPAEVTPQPIDDISDITLAEVGADVIENPIEITPQPIDDISAITLAEAGADVIENPVEITPQPIDDISAITLAEVGADVIENPVEVTPQPIDDISDITLAEAGADIVETPKKKEKTPEPDISDLTLK